MSSWRAEKPLDLYLQQNGIRAIADIDTRKLTRLLREKARKTGVFSRKTVWMSKRPLSWPESFPA